MEKPKYPLIRFGGGSAAVTFTITIGPAFDLACGPSSFLCCFPSCCPFWAFAGSRPLPFFFFFFSLRLLHGAMMSHAQSLGHSFAKCLFSAKAEGLLHLPFLAMLSPWGSYARSSTQPTSAIYRPISAIIGLLCHKPAFLGV